MKNEETNITIFEEKMSAMQKMVDNVEVKNEEDYAALSDKVKQINLFKKALEQAMDKNVAPAKLIIENEKAKYQPKIKACEIAIAKLKQVGVIWYNVREQLRLKEEAKIAAKVEAGKLKPETAIKKLEDMPEQKKTVVGEGSAMRMSKYKVVVIEKPELIPDEFWVIDEVKVRKHALALDKIGQPQIPGVIIKEETRASSF